jgi:hypothetical protein
MITVMDGHGHGDQRSLSKRNWNETGTELERFRLKTKDLL